MDYPASIVPVNHIEPAPRRVRASLGGGRCWTRPGRCTSGSGRTIRSTTSRWPTWTRRCWSTRNTRAAPPRTARRHGLRVGRPRPAGRRAGLRRGRDPGLPGTARFDWDALDAWFEEDEQVFVHPRNPYTRVDALRSNRTCASSSRGGAGRDILAGDGVRDRPADPLLPQSHRVALRAPGAHRDADGVPVQGHHQRLLVGRGSATHVHPDLAWAYDFPTRQLQPIAGLVAFYNERVDIDVDGERLDRPQTHFSRTGRDGS